MDKVFDTVTQSINLSRMSEVRRTWQKCLNEISNTQSEFAAVEYSAVESNKFCEETERLKKMMDKLIREAEKKIKNGESSDVVN